MDLNPLQQLKKEIFRSEDFNEKNLAQMVERVKDIQYERRVAQERVRELEIRIGQMREYLASLKRLIWN